MHAFTLLAAMLISTPSQELIDAVLAGDEKEARAFLEAGADANARNDDGLSALSLAAKSGHSDVAALLLEFGADVDARIGFDDTPLMMAARDGDPETVEVLIDAGADVNAETLYGGTALSIASTNNHVKVTSLLLDAGADPEKVGGLGQETALTKAIREQRDDDAALLIAGGEEVTAYALVVAAREGSAEIVDILEPYVEEAVQLEEAVQRFKSRSSSANNASERALRVGGDLRPPRKIKDVRPVYPDEAKDKGIQGVVILEAIIDSQGNVAHVEVLRSIPALDEAAIDAVKQWKYEPTIVDGVPVPIWMTVTTNFALE